MKNFLCIIVINICFFTSYSQVIPYGNSMDSIVTDDGSKYYIYYYKPLNYDTTTSPILWGIHGIGGNGSGVIGNLQAIADRRKSLIVAPTMHSSWYWAIDRVPDNGNCNWHLIWLPVHFKQIYRHVLDREARISVPVHLIGFSAGGQCVSRYMLIRQGISDSIPIRMAVSSSGFFYTFPVDTLNGTDMFYPCGLSQTNLLFYCTNPPPDTLKIDFICDEHVVQYYNENYAVLVGSADNDTTDCWNNWTCTIEQGCSRYERAQNFYTFSDSDAVVRGTTLKWQYGEVPGVGHNENLMYNTILAGDSMPLAERLLFETPYHTVPSLAPHANFNADTTIVTLPSATVQFYNSSINTTNFLWDFGDGTTNDTDIDPLHTYLYPDTFTVTLTAFSLGGCSDKIIKTDFIVVNPVGIYEYGNNIYSFSVYPNPANETFNIGFPLSEGTEPGVITIYDLMGRKVKSILVTKNEKSLTINTTLYPNGLYFIVLSINGEIKAKNKLIIIK